MTPTKYKHAGWRPRTDTFMSCATPWRPRRRPKTRGKAWKSAEKRRKASKTVEKRSVLPLGLLFRE